MKKTIKIFTIFLAILTITFFSSCTTLSFLTLKKHPQIKISRNILAPGVLTSYELAAFFKTKNSNISEEEIQELALNYVIEGMSEGINYSVAFAQMCLETGYLKFGNLVTPQMHNYCGLGAMDKDHPGESFETMAEGVRAHIQHLHAYATPPETSLKNKLIDPRYNWVHKTKTATTIKQLSGVWATDLQYDAKIEAIILQIEEFINSN